MIEGDLPVAALTRSIDAGKVELGSWLRADPVHLKADRDRVVMFGNRDLNVTMTEAVQLANEFNHFFCEDDIRLETPTPTRWYLRLPSPPRIKTTPLADVVGQDIHPLLPRGEEAIIWHKLLNESQMLFHSSETNQRRTANGQPTINSLWLWGGGPLPERKPVDWQGIWSSETLASALAEYFGIAHTSTPVSAENLLNHTKANEAHMVILEGATEAAQFQDIGAWRQFIEEFSSEWITPLLQAIKEGRLNGCRIVSTEGENFTVTTKNLRRWWKRCHPLSHFMT